MLSESEQLIGKSHCMICDREQDLTKLELIELLKDCQTIEQIKSFIQTLQIGSDIIMDVECPECSDKYQFERQRW